MKDPSDTRKGAYDLLEVSHDASAGEIKQAYAKGVRKMRSRRTDIMRAWHKLRKPSDRFEEDFWYYRSSDQNLDMEDETVSELSEKLLLEPSPPSLNLGLEMTDLAEGHNRGDYPPLEFRTVQVKEIETYDDPPVGRSMPVRFDQ